MNNYISVEQALSKGRKQILYPMLFIIIVGVNILLSLFLFVFKHFDILTILTCLTFPILTAVLYLAYAIPRWKLWAYTKVDDLNGLKQKVAVFGIFTDNHPFWNQIAILSPKKKQLLEQVCNNNKSNTVYFKYSNLPSYTVLENKNSEPFLKTMIGLALCLTGIYLLLQEEYPIDFIIPTIALIFGVFISISSIKLLFSNKTIVVLSHQGVVIDKELIPWKNISKIEANTKPIGETFRDYLLLITNGNSYELSIDHLNYSVEEINELIDLYCSKALSSGLY
ncbi:hypothetical protein HGP29_21095 [Flammeovirga sp. SR4]|uniref:Uncharacterized protein n=1 Tax=Flammeovirga agarivorans TaxID=2726742 RepID=A0A7X8XY48_9BACT|nr:hypothetical protein [Flammeovirga agarivorans]